MFHFMCLIMHYGLGVLNSCMCRFYCDAVVCWYCGFIYDLYTCLSFYNFVFGFIVPRYEKLANDELILSIADRENVYITQ